jgi:thiol-disulfide isomerase/thioredoxin
MDIQLKLFKKVWSSFESMKGESCGLGFIFLYSLLSGESRRKVVGGDYGGYGGGGGGGGGGGLSLQFISMVGRLLVLLQMILIVSQPYLLSYIYTDRRTKSLPNLVINVLMRNRQVSLRMPKFKDSRKSQSPFFIGWTDDQEPFSPLADLFSKVAPMMSTLRRKGTFHFPPGPPHPELAAPPKTIEVQRVRPVQAQTYRDEINNNVVYVENLIPEISDYGCESRVVTPVSVARVSDLVNSTRFRMRTDKIVPKPPVLIEDTKHFQNIVNDNPDKLIVLDFFATWCGPCKAFAPVYHLIALKTPTAIFLKADIDECDVLAGLFQVQSVPTVFMLRGSSKPSNALVKVQGGVQFCEQFPSLINLHSTKEELFTLKDFLEGTPSESKSVGISADENEVTTLANQPLLSCSEFIENHRRADLGLRYVNPNLAFDVQKHESTSSC